MQFLDVLSYSHRIKYNKKYVFIASDSMKIHKYIVLENFRC